MRRVTGILEIIQRALPSFRAGRISKGVFVGGVFLLAWMLFQGTPVWANGGPHGDYTATTDKCAACHRTHTAQGPKLITAASVHELCLSCHGAAGTGAYTDVENGVYTNTNNANQSRTGDVTSTPFNAPLRAGGFVSYLGNPVTSTHEYQGGSFQAWGGGGTRGQLGGTSIVMTCTTCHDPHGSSNYRILRTTINTNPVTVGQVDETNKNYGYDTTDSDGDGLFWPADRDETDFTGFAWPTDYSNVCAACHPPYHNLQLDNTTASHDVDFDASLYIDTGEVFPTYTDPDGVTVADPLANVDTGNKNSTALAVCGTCHLAHGTSTQMTGYAADPRLPTGGDSALLRWNNRGVCQACHRDDNGSFRGELETGG